MQTGELPPSRFHPLPSSGDYLGVVTLASGERYPVSLTLLFHRMSQKWGRGVGVMKLYRDDPRFNEFMSYHYPQVGFNRTLGKLSFRPSRAKTYPRIVDLFYEREHERFRGRMVLPGLSTPQPVELRYTSILQKDLKVVFRDRAKIDSGRSFSGLYTGRCMGEQVDLELQAMSVPRSQPEVGATVLSLNGGFRLRSSMCRKPGADCSIELLQNSSGNIFTQHLNLELTGRSLRCKKRGTDLICGDNCQLRQQEAITLSDTVSREQVSSGELRLDPIGELRVLPVASELVGSYSGYLYHEALDRYQFVRLSIAQYSDRKRPGRNWMFLGGHANLFFGSPEKQEFISYVFVPRRFVPERKVFVLDGKGEAFLSVCSWHQNGIRAWWYSKTHGRIGAVDLRKEKVRVPGKQVRFVSGLSGFYEALDQSFSVRAFPGFSLASGDLYPLRVTGSRIQAKTAKEDTIQSVFYDFYQDRLRMVFEDQTAVSMKSEDAGLLPQGRQGTLVRRLKANRATKERLAKKFSKKPKSEAADSPISLPIEKALNRALSSSPTYIK